VALPANVVYQYERAKNGPTDGVSSHDGPLARLCVIGELKSD